MAVLYLLTMCLSGLRDASFRSCWFFWFSPLWFWSIFVLWLMLWNWWTFGVCKVLCWECWRKRVWEINVLWNLIDIGVCKVVWYRHRSWEFLSVPNKFQLRYVWFRSPIPAHCIITCRRRFIHSSSIKVPGGSSKEFIRYTKGRPPVHNP